MVDAATSTPSKGSDIQFTTNLDKIKKEKSPSTAETSGKSLAGDFDTFLLLLTTQLKNQDPTAPLDTNQFTQQLVAFSGVEQAIATNKNLEKLISLNSGTQINNAVTYIGRQIAAEGNEGVLENGQAKFAYDLPAGATSVTVSITDKNGRVVYSGKGGTKEGRNTVLWDGIDSFTSVKLPDGVYKLNILAKDAKDKTLEAQTLSTGKVSSASIEGGEVVLSLGSIKVPLDKVVSVSEPAAAASTTASTSSSTTSGTSAGTGSSASSSSSGTANNTKS